MKMLVNYVDFMGYIDNILLLRTVRYPY